MPNLKTGPLTLRPLQETDLPGFSAVHADPQVMADLGGPIPKDASRQKLEDFIASFDRHGYGRMAVLLGQDFVGYVGVKRTGGPDHPLGPHDEIGWRILPRYWGQGLATLAARAAITDAFDRAGLEQVLAYTGPDNLRSQAVMSRLRLIRAPEMDFSEHYPPIGQWHGMVWRVKPTDWARILQKNASEIF